MIASFSPFVARCLVKGSEFASLVAHVHDLVVVLRALLMGVPLGVPEPHQLPLDLVAPQRVNGPIETLVGGLVHENVPLNLPSPLFRRKEPFHAGCQKGWHQIDTIASIAGSVGERPAGPCSYVENILHFQPEQQFQHHQRFIHAFGNDDKVVIVQYLLDNGCVVSSGGQCGKEGWFRCRRHEVGEVGVVVVGPHHDFGKVFIGGFLLSDRHIEMKETANGLGGRIPQNGKQKGLASIPLGVLQFTGCPVVGPVLAKLESFFGG